MTVLIADANAAVDTRFGKLRSGIAMIRSILYADDTLLIDVSPETAQSFMDEIQRLGTGYGLAFNNKKLEILALNVDGDVYDSTGKAIAQKDRIVYLGCILSADACVHSEVGRRIGAANAVFKELE